MTRPANAKYTDTGAVARKKDGKCSTCITGGQKVKETKVDPALLVADYIAGLSLGQIRTKHGVAKDTAKRHILRAGVPMRPGPSNLTPGTR